MNHLNQPNQLSGEIRSFFRGGCCVFFFLRRRPLQPKDLENQPDAQMQMFLLDTCSPKMHGEDELDAKIYQRFQKAISHYRILLRQIASVVRYQSCPLKIEARVSGVEVFESWVPKKHISEQSVDNNWIIIQFDWLQFRLSWSLVISTSRTFELPFLQKDFACTKPPRRIIPLETVRTLCGWYDSRTPPN